MISARQNTDPHQQKVILTTERLLLREMGLGDLDFIAAMLGHPEVMKYYPKLYSREEAKEWIRRQESRYVKDGYGLWLILLRKDQVPVGQAGLVRHVIEGKNYDEIGYLVHRPYWRNYYATEAAIAIREYAFTNLQMNKVCSLIRPENLPSRGVAAKLGMTAEKEVMFSGFPHLHYFITKDQ